LTDVLEVLTFFIIRAMSNRDAVMGFEVLTEVKMSTVYLLGCNTAWTCRHDVSEKHTVPLFPHLRGTPLPIGSSKVLPCHIDSGISTRPYRPIVLPSIDVKVKINIF
jgi:hypothetical protein